VTGELTRLFHPRRDVWSDHFAWVGHELVGLTAIGRTTVIVLAMNADSLMSFRAALMLDGPYPPTEGG
jgi:hypothetical protein